MKLGDIVEFVEVDPRKLTSYALDPQSPKGRDKAALFESLLGFTRENHEDLIQQIKSKALNGETELRSEDEYGRRYAVDLPIEGTEGRRKRVRTGWLVPPRSKTAHLVTLFVKKESGHHG